MTELEQIKAHLRELQAGHHADIDALWQARAQLEAASELLRALHLPMDTPFLDAVPAIDALEANQIPGRCGECGNWERYTDGLSRDKPQHCWCCRTELWHGRDHFCGWFEKREAGRE